MHGAPGLIPGQGTRSYMPQLKVEDRSCRNKDLVQLNKYKVTFKKEEALTITDITSGGWTKMRNKASPAGRWGLSDPELCAARTGVGSA